MIWATLIPRNLSLERRIDVKQRTKLLTFIGVLTLCSLFIAANTTDELTFSDDAGPDWLSLSTGLSGTPDTSFGYTGLVMTLGMPSSPYYQAIAVDSTNKVIAAGRSGNGWVVARYNTDGTLDTSFGSDGLAYIMPDSYAVAYDVAVDSSDRIVVVGRTTWPGEFTVVRLTSSGSFDSTFGGDGKAEITIDQGAVSRAVEIQPDGKIVVSGYAFDRKGVRYIVLARFNTDGSLDTDSFGTPNDARAIRKGAPPFKGYLTDNINSKLHDEVYAGAMALQADGKIVVGGSVGSSQPEPRPGYAILRYVAHGRDTSFASNGILTAAGYGPFDNLHLRDVDVQSDGKILASGVGWNAADSDAIVVRYTSSGALDTAFGTSGLAYTGVPVPDHGNQLAIQGDGKIVVGDQYWNGSDSDFMVFRFNADGSADSSFGNNGQSSILACASGSHELSYALALDNAGDILLCGLVGIPSGQYMAIAKYNK
jgi:uncharacterized delta-60 repeat protein